MKSKKLAVFGIGAYVLGVVASATDLEGNSIVPVALVAISAVTTIIFIIMAVVRLWRRIKSASILLASSAVILFILTAVQESVQSPDGSLVIILLNAFRLIYFLAFAWAVSLLWAIAKHE